MDSEQLNNIYTEEKLITLQEKHAKVAEAQRLAHIQCITEMAIKDIVEEIKQTQSMSGAVRPVKPESVDVSFLQKSFPSLAITMKHNPRAGFVQIRFEPKK